MLDYSTTPLLLLGTLVTCPFPVPLLPKRGFLVWLFLGHLAIFGLAALASPVLPITPQLTPLHFQYSKWLLFSDWTFTDGSVLLSMIRCKTGVSVSLKLS